MKTKFLTIFLPTVDIASYSLYTNISLSHVNLSLISLLLALIYNIPSPLRLKTRQLWKKFVKNMFLNLLFCSQKSYNPTDIFGVFSTPASKSSLSIIIIELFLKKLKN